MKKSDQNDKYTKRNFFNHTKHIKIQGNLKIIVRNSMLVYAKIKYFAFLVIIVDTAKMVTKLWK